MNAKLLCTLIVLCAVVCTAAAQGQRRQFGRFRGIRNQGGQTNDAGERTDRPRNRGPQGGDDSNEGGAGRDRRLNGWRGRAGARRKSMWMRAKNSWNVALPNGAVAKETAFLRTPSGQTVFRMMQNVMWMMSRSENLEAAGYQTSFTMADFNSGLIATRVELPDVDAIPPQASDGDRTNWRQRMRYWRNKNHACFVSEIDYSILDAASELSARNQSETTVAIGQEKTMYAQLQNALTESDIMFSAIGRLCGRAARDNKAFRLVSTDDGLQYSTTTFTVLGQIDAGQPGKSVPLKVFVDSSIDLSDSPPTPE